MNVQRSQNDIEIERILGAPEELKAKHLAFNNCMARVLNAKRQLKLWMQEMEIASMEMDFRHQELEDLKARWDENSNTIKPDDKMEISL